MSLLVVEDNTISLRMLEVLLQSNGYTVVSAKTGRQALDRLEEREDIQMVLTDLIMPEMDGLQLLDELGRHPRWKTLPVIVLTSLNDADTVRRVVQAGCRNYLVKPLKEEIVIPKVKALLAAAPGVAKPAPLKAKFQVLKDRGLDPDQYDRLFEAFHVQVREASTAAATVASVVAEDAVGTAVLALRDGAEVLAQGRLPALLDGLRARGSCEPALVREVLQEILTAMDGVAAMRARLKEKVERGEATAP